MLNFAPGGNPYQQYKRSAVETATPEKLLLMLFDGAIKFVNQAQAAIDDKNYEQANTVLLKVQDILRELMFTLNLEQGGELAQNMRLLYDFYLGEVVKANITKDSKLLQPVLEFLRMYRDVWAEAGKLSRGEAK